MVGAELAIEGEIGHHYARVLRSRIGEQLVVAATNGPHLAVVSAVDAKAGRIDVRIETAYPAHEARVRIVLIQGVAKGDKMDTIVQKAVEVGVMAVVAYEAQRSVVQLADKRSSKLARWEKIAESAASQAQRDVVPLIQAASSPGELTEVCRRLGVSTVLLLDEDETACGLRNALESAATDGAIGIAVGPEGGWDDTERLWFRDQLAAQAVTLGPRIFRTETAGLAAAAAVLYHHGELGG